MIENPHALRAHSKLGASSAKRWMNCPGSVALIDMCPTPPPSPYAEEGTAAHELAETVLAVTTGAGPNAFYYIGKQKFNGFDVTSEMAEHAQGYVDYVRNIKNELKGELLIEYKFHLKHIHPDFYGTCDAVVMQPFGELHVFDFKYGAGVAVEVEESEQLMFYALGALELGDFTKVVLHICQPRAHHSEGGYRKWETTPEKLVEFGKLLRQKAIETTKKDAPTNPGEYCRWCSAAAVCPSLSRRAIETAQTDFADKKPTLPEPKMMTLQQIGKVIEYRKQIESWFDAVEEFALNATLRGEKIEGCKLVAGRSSRQWINHEVAEKELCKILGERAHERKLITVSQAEKLVESNDLQGLFHVISGKPTIAPTSDRRKELVSAKDAFTKVETVSVEDF